MREEDHHAGRFPPGPRAERIRSQLRGLALGFYPNRTVAVYRSLRHCCVDTGAVASRVQTERRRVDEVALRVGEADILDCKRVQPRPVDHYHLADEIGRGSCSARGEISGGTESLKK